MALSTAAVWGDINNDGLLDLYLGNTDAPNALYLNKGDLTFEDITEKAGVGDPFDPRSVQFADVDNDGYLDIYVHNFNTQNVLYRNNGDNTFEDITQISGAVNLGPAMGTIFFDMDNDGDQDLYVLNDGDFNALFENKGDGRFEDVTEGSGLGIYCSCMGVDFGDMDNDGDFDIYVTNYGDNFLFENNGDGTFTEKGVALDVNDNGMGWSTFWFDYDNDGDQDIYLANHQNIGGRPNMLYRNAGGNAFELVSEGENIESRFASFGSASGDVNNDGLSDFVVANWGATVRNQLFVNDLESNGSVLIKASGTKSNRSAIGAKVTVKTNGLSQTDQVTGATGYASQNSLVLHFGLGNDQKIDELKINWPSGQEEIYHDLSANVYLTVTEGEGYSERPLNNDVITSLEGQPELNEYSYPNPFQTRTFIPIGQNYGPKVSLEVTTINGNEVARRDQPVIVDEKKGFYWDGTDFRGVQLQNGVYFYTLRDENLRVLRSGKLLLQR